MPPIEYLFAYWSAHEIATNGVILLNLVGALLLGLMVGYERSYHGRAAGMRTYGLVCMASAALTVIGGYPGDWFGGQAGHTVLTSDPTRIVQGIVTGIGFYLGAMGLAVLCAGSMIFLSKLEAWLPSRHAIAITMRFKAGYLPQEPALRAMALQRGYEIAGGSLMIGSDGGMQEWRFVAIALSKRSGAPMAVLSAELAQFDGIHSFQLSHARN